MNTGAGAGLSSFVTSRPVAILMVFLAVVVFGGLSLGRLPLALMPELTYPTLTVRTEYPGAAPEEVENDISRPVEEALGVVNGLQKISSISRADVSDVLLEFGWNTTMSEATQDVLERLDLVLLPTEARRPLILHYDPSLDPVMELSLSGTGTEYSGPQGLRRLRRLADLQVRRALEPIKGVAAVRIQGGLEEEVHVLLQEEQLRRTGISIQTVIQRLQDENINVAGGTIKEGRTEYMVRTLNEYEHLDEIEDTVITRVDGRDVRLRDLGRVEAAHRDREILTRTDGGESVQIEVFKEADANIVSLAQAVKAAVGEVPRSDTAEVGDTARAGGIQRRLAPRLFREEAAALTVVADRSLFIQSSIQEVRNTAVLGGLLAVIILFLFLKHFVSTIIVALSIPISLLITFAPLNLMGVSLNIMSLGGLALGVGMLVDSSIVVLESIHRCREEGDGLVQAAVRGTEEVRSAVVASIFTSIAVFFPMVFVEGVAGQAFGDLGLAVVFSLLASLAVALFFIPMLASRQGMQLGMNGESGASGSWLRFSSWSAFSASVRSSSWWTFIPGILYWLVRLLVGMVLELAGKVILLAVALVMALIRFLIWPVVSFVFRLVIWLPLKITDALMAALERVYPVLLRRALQHQMVVMLVLALTIFASWRIVRTVDSELLPEVHQGEFTVEVALPVGTPLEETERLLTPIEKAILTEKEHIRALILTVGYDSTTSVRSDEGEHTGRFKVLLEPSRDPAAQEEQVINRLRQRFSGIPDLTARMVRPVLFSAKTPIEVEVHGDDLFQLREYADQVREVMAGMPQLADVQSTLQRGAPEVQILYDRDRLSRYDLKIGDVARRVRDKVKGFEATRYNLKDRRIPIVVRLDVEDRETVDQVRALQVNPGGDHPIPLASVATVTLGEGPSEVRRIDGRRVAVVRASISAGSLSAANEAIARNLNAQMSWPQGMTFFISGQNEEWERSRASLWLALGLSIFLVYVIMAAQFESLVQPFVIMFTIPLAFIGTVMALRILNISLSVVVFLGMIMLAGIVVNNAIVLLDYINTLRRRGVPRDQAIVTAGSIRLRPILMTTATTVLGLAPMALGLGDGAEIRTPMAMAVISGLLSSTALTLVIIPTLYATTDSLMSRFLGQGQPEAAATLGGLGTGDPETVSP